jgi:NAD(P)-dependent dehydrogenase (short-subunit alcohol dehydrogenase family)
MAAEESGAKVAFVTGASRGIGKAIAIHLARAGFDVAVAARTMVDGEAREHSSTIKKSDTKPLPGSVAATVAQIEAEGRRAMPIFLDLLDRASLGAAVARVEERWGRIDLLVNNGRYVGPGHMDHFVDTPIEVLDRHVQANVLSPLVLIDLVLPGMLARGSGMVVNLTSGSGQMDPPAPAGSGGWGLGYGMSKAAIHRVAGLLAVELGDRGILFFNMDPGYVATERIAQDMAEFGFDNSTGAPTDVIGAATAWLATSPEAPGLNGSVIDGQALCRDRQLLPDWP